MSDSSTDAGRSLKPVVDRNGHASENPVAQAPELRFGPGLQKDSGVVFRLFAPAASSVRVVLDEHEPHAREVAMQHAGNGWYEVRVDDAGPGTRYRFVLPNGMRVPDPASRYAPLGVHDASEVVDPDAFHWNDAGWRGRPWNDAVLYELHIGTFTPEGTFRAAIEELDHLKSLCITAVELMCICAFAGQRSWGYDGVQIYAPDATYGRPEDLKAFIDAAHARGIMVILDVVYNHFGPEGNYIPSYFPQIFSETHKTAWGPGLNFDGPYSHEVREFIVQNAIYWTREFHIDGLRLDASHALLDNSPRHILTEITERVHAAAGDRHVHLILENEQRITKLLKRGADGKSPYTAQWNHAIDHMLGLSMSGQCDSADTSRLHQTEELARALTEGFFSGYDSRSPGEQPCVAPTAFISFIQTHDLIGNRVFGERIDSLASPEAVRAVAAVLLLLPQIPMLFMGEEWAATTPFPFFSDYGGELGDAIRRGRAMQLKKTLHVDDETLSRAPDPQAASTFLSATLRWDDLKNPDHAERLEWYRRVLAARQEHLHPLLDRLSEDCGKYIVHGNGQFECEWQIKSGGRLRLCANLCDLPSDGFGLPLWADALWQEGTQDEAGHLGPWSVRWELLMQR